MSTSIDLDMAFRIIQSGLYQLIANYALNPIFFSALNGMIALFYRLRKKTVYLLWLQLEYEH